MKKRVRIRRTKQVISMVALSGGLALGGYGIASASTPSTTTTSASASASTPAAPTLPPGGGAWSQGIVGGGTVVSVTPTTLVVRDPAGSVHTYSLTSTTTYSKGGTSSTFSALGVNERVFVRTSSSSSTVATNVQIVEPRLSGTVESISGSSIVISDAQGFWHTIAVSTGTQYEEGSTAISLSSLKVGDAIAVSGTIASNHTTLDASTVELVLPSFVGQVSSISGNVISLTTPNGTTETVNVSSSTTYSNNGASSSLSAITKGSTIRVVGIITGTNTVSASSIELGTPKPPVGHGGPGQGGPGFGGPRFGGPGQGGPGFGTNPGGGF